MKPFKKVQRKLERRLKHHSDAMAFAKSKSASGFNPAGWRIPGSRNPRKS